MRKILLAATAFVLYLNGAAQLATSISVVKENGNTATKDQANTGTCWSFATLSFIESEALRMGKDTLDLSEMFMVHYAYPKKALKYFEKDNKSPHFAQGGLAHDVMYIVKNYGLLPESVYNGLQYGTNMHNHNEPDAILQGLVSNLRKNEIQPSTHLLKSIDLILDTYLGEVPSYFDFKGKNYTPQSFAKEVVGINPDDYITLTSFTHHPVYSKFVLEIPDNWFGGEYYNLELNELTETLDYAIENGFTVAWDGDVSEREFAHKKGIALWPAKLWKEKSAEEQTAYGTNYEEETKVTPEIRQQHFENGTTTDDHLMHITGLAKDTSGNKYYITKNSWGENSNAFKGKLFMSDAYVKMKTIAITVHKNAVPKKIQKKLGF